MVKRFIKSFMELTPYRIVRHHGANRFYAIEPCLRMIKARGFAPRVVIDGGAHHGSFSVAARAIFPDATFHLVEPQLACSAPLRKLCAGTGFVFHPYALVEKDGPIALTPTSEPSTGAHIASGGEDAVFVAGTTLDALFGAVAGDDRALLKLDLQGYELHALRGGVTLLKSVEVILTEVSFFAQAYEPPIAALVSFLNDHGFQLYDIAALGGRARDNRLQQGDVMFVRAESQLLEDGAWE
jgi:FkbM family methyltransferase